MTMVGALMRTNINRPSPPVLRMVFQTACMRAARRTRTKDEGFEGQSEGSLTPANIVRSEPIGSVRGPG